MENTGIKHPGSFIYTVAPFVFKQHFENHYLLKFYSMGR